MINAINKLKSNGRKLNKKYIIIGIVAVVLIVIFFMNHKSSQKEESVVEVSKKYVKTEIVNPGNFDENLKLIGQIRPLEESIISAQAQGTIQLLNVDVGKKVRKGDLLAKIDTTSSGVGTNMNNASIAYQNSIQSYSLTKESIEKDIENALTQMQNAKKSKENTYDSTDKQLALAQAQLDNIKTNKKNTVITNDQLIKLSEIGVETAQKGYDSAKLNLDNFEKNIVESMKSKIETNLVNTNTLLNYIDLILGVTEANKDQNDSFETFLSAKKVDYKNQAEDLLKESLSLYNQLKQEDVYSADYVRLKILLDKNIELVKKVVSLNKKMIDVLDNSVEGNAFTQTVISTYKQTISTNQSAFLQIQSEMLGIKTSISTQTNSLNNAIDLSKKQLDNANQNLENARASTTSSIENLEGNENLIKIQLESTISTIKTARDNADDAYKMAQLQYDSLLAKNNNALVQSKSQLDSVRGQKDLAGVQINNTEIRAPFDGVIMQKNISIGQLVNPGSPAFVIGKDENFKLRMDIDSDSVKFISVGKVFKATKMDNSFTGNITLVSPSSDSQTKLFEVQGDFNGDKKDYVLGDYLDVFITKQIMASNVISVPYSSLISLGQGKYIVFIVDEKGLVRSKEVIVGEKNEERVIIKSGLNAGDKIVVNGAMGLQDGEEVLETK